MRIQIKEHFHLSSKWVLRGTVFLFALLASLAPGLEMFAAEGITVYPSYRPRFDARTETFSLKSTIFVLNTGDEELKKLIIRQSVPPPMSIRFAEFTDEEKARRPEGFKESIDGGTYEVQLPVLRPKEGALLQNELSMPRRLGQKTFPGIFVEYDLGSEREVMRSADNLYDLTIYADHVGDLKRFLRKRCKISLDLTSGRRKIWEFEGQDANASGSNPIGILGVHLEKEKEGWYRLRSGTPGDLLEVLVVWRPVRVRDGMEEPKELVEKLEGYLRWVGNFKFDRSSLHLKRTKFRKFSETLTLEGRWKDQVANRLGEGPFQWYVMFSRREAVEYYLLVMAQGRGLGAEESKTPQPEKEEQLMAEARGYAQTFRSTIVPLSYK